MAVALTPASCTGPDFTVDSNHVQTITFGTCRFFFENISPAPLTYCWLSLVRVPNLMGL